MADQTLPNINEVTFDELRKIQFLGPSRCRNIVAYVEMHNGKIADIMQLANANGIGASMAARLKEHFSATPLPEGLQKN